MWGGGDLTPGSLGPESMPVNFAPTYWPANRRSGSGSNQVGWPRVLVFAGPSGFWGAGEGLSVTLELGHCCLPGALSLLDLDLLLLSAHKVL